MNKSNVFTQKMFEQLLGELRTRIKEDLKGELHKLDGKLDWIVGKYRNHDKEHILLNHRISEHSDNLDIINTKLGIQLC